MWHYIGWSLFGLLVPVVGGIVIYGATLLFVMPGEWLSGRKKK